MYMFVHQFKTIHANDAVDAKKNNSNNKHCDSSSSNRPNNFNMLKMVVLLTQFRDKLDN